MIRFTITPDQAVGGSPDVERERYTPLTVVGGNTDHGQEVMKNVVFVHISMKFADW